MCSRPRHGEEGLQRQKGVRHRRAGEMLRKAGEAEPRLSSSLLSTFLSHQSNLKTKLVSYSSRRHVLRHRSERNGKEHCLFCDSIISHKLS
jgi:hypothetical protein